MHLFVAVPSHSGSLMMETAFTLCALQRIANEQGMEVTFATASGAVISEVRNVIVARFLESTADHLLMMDSDQAFSEEVLLRILSLGQPVVGCIYPMRRLNWAKTDLATASSLDQILYQASEYVGRLEFDASGAAQIINGFAKALHIGTGLMLVRRRVFETLMEQHPELRKRGFPEETYEGLGTHNWGFFNHIEVQDGCAISEDISFCRRWRASGGEIWADVTSNTEHIGRYSYRGNYLDYLAATRAVRLN